MTANGVKVSVENAAIAASACSFKASSLVFRLLEVPGFVVESTNSFLALELGSFLLFFLFSVLYAPLEALLHAFESAYFVKFMDLRR